MMTAKWITQIDGSLVRIWEPAYREDATFADVDHPYGTCGSTAGHEGHWTDPLAPSAAVQEATEPVAEKWHPRVLFGEEKAA